MEKFFGRLKTAMFLDKTFSSVEDFQQKISAKRKQMRQLPEFMMLSSLETRDFEAAEREELQALISTLPIEKVRQLLQELR
ncbi:MAG: hypothetical protein E7052_00695 [Lentisphaerae bacterium]|nr:hypothetical protein [Lentisphaerota bacterium]